MKVINPDKCVVFFDFDNTISTVDVLDNMLPRFSRDGLWIELEKQWRGGKIGSEVCLEGQIRGLSTSKHSLDEYLSGIKLDPYFKKLIKLLNAKKVKAVVLSDNFDYILRRILNHNHKVSGLRVYSNRLRFSRNRLTPYFPYRSKNCQVCAHCKTKNLLENVNRDSVIIYVGDGRTDICPARYADIVFAKDDLLKHYKNIKAACFSYKGLKDVYDYFKRSL